MRARALSFKPAASTSAISCSSEPDRRASSCTASSCIFPLDGRRPFAVSGAAHFSGKIQEEAVQLDARLSGSLEQLIAEVEAAGLKLSARARIHATPFAETPFKTL